MNTTMMGRALLCLGWLLGVVSACSDDGSPGGAGGATAGAGGAGGSTGGAGGSSGSGAGTGGDAGTGGSDGGTGDAGQKPCQIDLSLGTVGGKLVESNTCEFLGLPYAKPPVGALRFAPPQAAVAWQGVRDGTTFGPGCMQRTSVIGGGANLSEDCLTLNVYTPEPAPAAKLPVMVFIHGGGFTLGTSGTYDGRLLAQRGPAVVVTINYRLGVFGFFAHPALDDERAGAPSGSDGIRDQQLALRWVKDNISSFHGDPGNVTVFGESAGSFSTALHVVSPGSRELAHRFILESGAAVGAYGSSTRDVAYALGTKMSSELCAGAPDVIGCLRAKTAQELVDWTGGATGIFGAAWGPVIEGAGGVLPDAPQKLIMNNDYNRAAPIIAGTNKYEWGLFQQPALGGMPITTIAEFKANLAMQFGARAAEVEAQYPVATDAEANDVFIRLVTDATFRCPTRLFARLTAAHGSKVYLYSFEEGAAYHGDELSYVFGMPAFTGSVPSPALVAVTQGYWTRFAATGDPNGSGALVWPQYDAAGDQHLVLKNPPSSGSGLSKSDCDFWARFNL